MSYILEALKKAERQRPPGPVPDLFTVQGPQPQLPPRVPRAVLAGGAAAVVTAGLVAWAWLGTQRSSQAPPAVEQVGSPARAAGEHVAPAAPAPHPEPEAAPQPGSTGASSATAPSRPERPPGRAASARRGAARPAVAPPARAEIRDAAVPPVAPAPVAPAPPARVAPAAPASSAAAVPTAAPVPAASGVVPALPPAAIAPAPAAPVPAPAPAVQFPPEAAPAASPSALAPASGAAAAPSSEPPAVAPAAVPAPAPAPVPPADGRAVRLDELPESVRALAATVTITGVVWSDEPGLRLLTVQDRIVREGQEAAPGVRLEKIVPDGAVFSASGWRFRLGGF